MQAMNPYREFRERAQMTQRELANEIGIAPTTWGTWELGMRIPHIRQRRKIEAFGARTGVNTADLPHNKTLGIAPMEIGTQTILDLKE